MVRYTKQPPRSEADRTQREQALIATARKNADTRAAGYRERSLAIHPWVCARCGRAFVRENLSELTVHHKDHNHDNNPEDGSNWENLCLYCHDNEHARHEEHLAARGRGIATDTGESASTYQPFANLMELLQRKNT
ncbi:MAG: HNH nuclease family protein [Magnetococcales bacterium]|nr:HNH nuclease family protein [Magnetococcales bacterium]